jgi:RimJ/RimL family protein N-acetyltransferase
VTEVRVRPITGDAELDLFNQFPYVLNHEVAADLAAGRRRPEWLWLAHRGDQVIARLAWWALPHAASPFLLDIFDVDPSSVDTGVELLRTAFAATLAAGEPPPDHIRFVPPDWRDDEQVRRLVDSRMAALEQTGARLFVERLRLQWSDGAPVPPPSDRLKFRPADDRAELVSLMAQVLTGTLDAHSRRDLERARVNAPAGETAGDATADEATADEAANAWRVAAEQYDNEFLGYDSPHDWWQIATRPDGEPVGFVIPARNSYHAIIAYVGVLPDHRGHGYIDDLLAEGTRILAAQGVPRIRAATDLGNVPMARAFQRAHYDNFERQLNMTWTPSP